MPPFLRCVRAPSRFDREPTRTPCEHVDPARRTGGDTRARWATSFGAAAATAALGVTLAACAVAPAADDAPASESDLAEAVTTEAPITTPAPSLPAPSATTPAPPVDAGADATEPVPPPALTAAALLAKLQGACSKVSSAPYARDVGGPANIDVCGLTNAVYFTADMDIDCDGKPTAVCNATTDPSFQAGTAAVASNGAPLDSSQVPFIVVPGVSSRWSYKTSGIAMGSVAAVIYDGKVELGIVGDIGPTSILGEASYAMATRLGINPDPRIGGSSGNVTYIVFTGTDGVVKKKEDLAEAQVLARARALRFLAEN